MPPSIFRGDPWPAAGQPLWTDLDRAEAVAFALEESGLCSGCRQPLDESTAPDAEGQYTVTELLCAGCQVRTAYAQDGHSYGGRMLHVRRREPSRQTGRETPDQT